MRVWHEEREHVARRLEIRQVALVSRHRLWAERREAAARKAASLQEGGSGLRGKSALDQERRRDVRREEEKEEANARERAERAAREEALIQAHMLAREENEYHERQRIIEMIWDLREIAVRQEEACAEAQRLDAEAEHMRSEAAAQEEAEVAANEEYARDRDAMARADVLESDWGRRARCVEQEAVWVRVWRAEEDERARRLAQRKALEDANRLAGHEREQVRCEAALEADWAYKAQSVEQEVRWAEVTKIVAAAEAADRNKREDEARRNRELEELWKSECERREVVLRDEVMEGDWARKGVAAQQEDAWRQVWVQSEEDIREHKRHLVSMEAAEAARGAVAAQGLQGQHRDGAVSAGVEDGGGGEEFGARGCEGTGQDDELDKAQVLNREESGSKQVSEEEAELGRRQMSEEEGKKRVRDAIIRLGKMKRDERVATEEKDRKRLAARVEEEASKRRVKDAMIRMGRAQRDEEAAAQDEQRRRDAERAEDAAQGQRVRQAIIRMQKAARDKRVEEEAEEAAETRRADVMRAEEAARKLRVREAMMKIEKESRARDAEQAKEREMCAQNRMRALSRERTLREDAQQEAVWRAAVSSAQDARRQLAGEWERAQRREREEERERKEKLDAMYRERERMQAEVEALAAEDVQHREVIERQREAALLELEEERRDELRKGACEREAQAERERKEVQEEYEKMRERAVAKALQQEDDPQVCERGGGGEGRG